MTSLLGVPFRASFDGRDGLAIVEAARRFGWAPRDDGELKIDFEAAPGIALSEAANKAQRQVACYYPQPPELIVIHRGDPERVQVGRLGVAIDIAELANELAEVPFGIASFTKLFLGEWKGYRAPGWADGHEPLGWAAAFRGAGHDRLVSRHWLETGPWKLWRGPNDVSLVQFHALDADPATALEQARIGHQLLGIGDSAGFIQSAFVYKHQLEGLYEATTKTMRVVIHGRELSDRELLEWAAARASKLDARFPFERVAFVFVVEAEARAQLPRLWKYGHEVWTIVKGNEVRLDLDYQPPDATPAWGLR